jgi:hypothetical protein
MRTQTVLIAATIGLAGALTTMAQVYSVNAVGYVTKQLTAGFNVLTNPLDAGAGNNTVLKLLGTGLPEGTLVYTYDPVTGYSINTWEFTVWTDPDQTLVPGQGFFVALPAGGSASLIFVGEVAQGAASNGSLPAGFALVGSKVPQAGKLATDLKFPAGEEDIVYKWDVATQNWVIYTFQFEVWDPREPEMAVGEGFWSRKVAGAAWDRNFSVNTP